MEQRQTVPVQLPHYSLGHSKATLDNTYSRGCHAVVIGASIGGLLAARVLAEHFEQVTLLERDTFPASGEQRKGVPQGRHAHALLARGRQILEELFPGLSQYLIDAGAVLGNGRLFAGGGFHSRPPCGLETLCVSRPRLEAEMRARVLALPNVRAVESCDVLGLVAGENGVRITGVRLIRRRAGSAEELLPADLVVDASGRGSRTPAWLEALGYPKPAEELVRVRMAYTSRLYERKPEHLHGDAYVNVAATPETRRAAALLAQEGNRWIVTLAGYFGNQAPTGDRGFLEAARGLPTTDIYQVLRHAQPLNDPIPANFPANQRRRYERVARFPEGLLVFGDAICSFNPVYGQGMTVCALEALALRDCLASGTEKLAQRFFRQAARVVDIPWRITVGNDLRIPGVEGRRTLAMRAINWYMGKLHVAARHDPFVAVAFQRAANLMAAPPSLMHPRVALRVLWWNLRRLATTTPRRPEIITTYAEGDA